MSLYLRYLKAKIKGLAAESVKMRQEINILHGMAKCDAWEDKRTFGEETRLHLLAYGFLKGKSYRDMEPVSNLEFFLRSYNIERLQQIIMQHTFWPLEKQKWTLDFIKDLIFYEKKVKEAA